MPYKENYPSVLLSEAVEAISSLPGVGRRSALRLALHLLKQPAENVHHFTSAINELRDKVCYCKRCRMISDDEICAICGDRSRDQRTICVVESVRDVMSIEATGQYHGVYHVSIKELTDRVAQLDDPAGAEVILALSGDVEGETTAFYIYRQIEATGIRITSLARGLGFGDDLEYADALTLGRSLTNRQLFKP